MSRLSRRTFLLGGGFAFCAYLFHEVNTIKVVRYTVQVRNLPPAFNGFTILHLSDLHQKEFGTGQERLVALIRRQRFDMVAVTGDLLLTSKPDARPLYSLISGFAPTPVFFVNGNNEWGAFYRHQYSIMMLLGTAGVTILDNRAVQLARGDRHLWIAGVDDPATRKDLLPNALSGTGDGAPVILLAHSPSIFPTTVKAGVDLVLVGHTHGGQVRIPLVGALWVPDMGFFPGVDYGEYREGGTTMIVNGGLGESIIPVRFNMPPEIVLVTLVPMGEGK